DTNFVLLRRVQIRTIEVCRNVGCVACEKAVRRERAIDRVRGVDARIRKGGLETTVAARMVEMPMRVDDGDDRRACVTNGCEDSIAMPSVAPGIDHCQAIRPFDDHRVAIRSAIRLRHIADYLCVGSYHLQQSLWSGGRCVRCGAGLEDRGKDDG